MKVNKIKIEYEGKDRMAICLFCREKRHYKLICKKFLEHQQVYENTVELEEWSRGDQSINIEME